MSESELEELLDEEYRWISKLGPKERQEMVNYLASIYGSAELAKWAGLTTSAISKYKKGEAEPSNEVIYKLFNNATIDERIYVLENIVIPNLKEAMDSALKLLTRLKKHVVKKFANVTQEKKEENNEQIPESLIEKAKMIIDANLGAYNPDFDIIVDDPAQIYNYLESLGYANVFSKDSRLVSKPKNLYTKLEAYGWIKNEEMANEIENQGYLSLPLGIQLRTYVPVLENTKTLIFSVYTIPLPQGKYRMVFSYFIPWKDGSRFKLFIPFISFSSASVFNLPDKVTLKVTKGSAFIKELDDLVVAKMKHWNKPYVILTGKHKDKATEIREGQTREIRNRKLLFIDPAGCDKVIVLEARKGVNDVINCGRTVIEVENAKVTNLHQSEKIYEENQKVLEALGTANDIINTVLTDMLLHTYLLAKPP